MKNPLTLIALVISLCCFNSTSVFSQERLIEATQIQLSSSDNNDYISLTNEIDFMQAYPPSSTCEPGDVSNDNNDPWSEECYLNDNCTAGSVCTANDVNLLGAFLADIDGNPIATCEFEEPTIVYLWGRFLNGTNTNRYAVRTRTEVWINGEFETELNSCSFNTLPPGATNQALIGEFTFTCGDAVEFRSTWVGWETANNSQCMDPNAPRYKSTCNDYASSKCSKDLAPIRLLSPNFSYTCADFTETSTEVCFQDLTTGGEPPLSYYWDFGYEAGLKGRAKSSEQNPCHVFPFTSGLYNVTLTVTDNDGITASATLPVDLDNLFCPDPQLSISKTASMEGCAQEGDEVIYTIIIENTGNQRIGNVVVSDPMLGFYSEAITLEIGEEVTFTESYNLTPADIASGTLSNTATVTGTSPFFVELEVSATETIDLYSLPTATAEKTDVTCHGGDNGSIVLTMTGGIAPYTYLWTHDNSINSAELSNLEAGTYEVTITDDNGCQAYYTYTINEPASGVNIEITPTDETCDGADDGTVTIVLNGGTAPYNVVITDENENIIPLDGEESMTTSMPERRSSSIVRRGITATKSSENDAVTVTASNLAPGNYTVTVTDANDCEYSDGFDIEAGDEIIAVITGEDGPVCPSTSSIYSAPADMYAYLWTISGNGSIDGPADEHSVTVIAGTDCDAIYTLTLTIANELGCEGVDNVEVLVESAELIVNAPESVTIPACSDTDIQAAYNTWVSGFTFNSDCDATDNLADIPSLPENAYCNGADLSFTYTVAGACDTKNETSAFTVIAPEALVVNAPASVEIQACTDLDIAAEYDAWKAGFTFNGDCNATDNIADIPALPADAFCNGADLSFTYEVDGDCDSDSKTSTFFVAPAPTVELTVPEDFNGTTCMSQEDIDAAYADWLAEAGQEESWR